MRGRHDLLSPAETSLLLATALVFAACASNPSDGTAGSGGTDGSGAVAASGGVVTTGGVGASTGGGGVATGGTGAGGSTGGISTTGGSAGSTAGTGGIETGGAGGGTGGSGGATFDCNTGTLTTRLPCVLSETGLYAADMETLADGVHRFTPQFPLWSDSADKHRWIWMPEGEQIDTSDMNFWNFPIGTKFFKDFWRDGKRVETRLNEKRPSGTWYTVAYIWNDEQTEAYATPDGQQNALGTEHDVPNADQCWACHSQTEDKILGFSAIQLSHAPIDQNDPDEFTLEKLIAANLLTDPPTGNLEFSAGWPDDLKQTFGYLHANCGTCHNPVGSANGATGLDMWLKIEDLDKDAEQSSVYLDIVGQSIVNHDTPLQVTLRVDPGNLENSAIYQRFVTKGEVWTMPTLGSEIADPTGKQLIEDFILGLPPTAP